MAEHEGGVTGLLPTEAVEVWSLVDLVIQHAWVWEGQVTRFFLEQWWTRMPEDVSGCVITSRAR